MSFCLSCAEWSRESPLCGPCAADLTPGPQWRLPSGLIVSAGLRHTGSARRLVHRLKYQGLTEAAGVLAGFMVSRLPPTAAALAPVPRARLRRLRYGLDPAHELVRALARLSGLPIVTPLRAPLWWGRHAARSRSRRGGPRFEVGTPTPLPAVLVDDVATSGATLTAAAAALGPDFRECLTATAPGRVVLPAPIDAEEVAWRQDRT